MNHQDGEHGAAARPDADEPETLGPPSALHSLRTRLGSEVDPSVDLQDEGETLAAPPSHRDDLRRRAAQSEATHDPRRYVVRSEIGRGGMGAILRVRDEDLRRDLAMKVLLGQAAPREGSEGMTRFLEEAQITSQLSHPGVVPVHDLGIDDSGRVFFTMSLVRGRTLAEIFALARSNSEGWSRSRALQVLLRVCETMAYAHDRGVIHRDLKPANVMVGKFGEVYVMDWGLAKVGGRPDSRDIRPQAEDPAQVTRIRTGRTDPDADAGADGEQPPLLTMDGSVLGTPAYMPPEQAEGRISEVDARSDVYSIGAMLYELLTGSAPYVSPGSRMSPYTILAAVAMGPPKPISELTPKTPEELVAITEKAMARAPVDRYASAVDLADDLQQFLSGHVVRAHRGGAMIELRKWVARNPHVARTVAAAAVLLAGVTGFFLWSLDGERDRAVDAEARATERAEQAETERARAEALATFMLEDLRERLEPVGRLDVLDAAAGKVLQHYREAAAASADRDRVRGLAKALEGVAEVERGQGDQAAARAALEEALELRSGLASAPDAPPDARDDLARVHQKLSYLHAGGGALERGLEHGREALRMHQALAADAPDELEWQRQVTVDLVALARILSAQGDAEGAAGCYAEARAVFERLAAADVDTPEWKHYLWTGYFTSGDVLAGAGMAEAALADFERALGLISELVDSEPTHGPWLRDLSVSHEGVGRMQLDLGRLDDALASFELAVAMRTRLTDVDPTNTGWQQDLAYGHGQLADVLSARGDDERAIEQTRLALAIHERLVEHDRDQLSWRADLAYGRRALADRLAALERAEQARESYEAAIGIFETLVALEPLHAEWKGALEQCRDRLAALPGD